MVSLDLLLALQLHHLLTLERNLMDKLTKEQIQKIDQKFPIHDQKFIILIDILAAKIPEHELNCNVYCIDEQCNIIWQVQREDIEKRYVANRLKMSSPVSVASLNLMRKDPLVDIKITNGELVANSFSGFKYKINIESGKSELIGWSK